MNKLPILLVISHLPWTLNALHLACAIAQRDATPLILLHMVPVNHPVMLGQPEGDLLLTDRALEFEALLLHTANTYGVKPLVQRCQYANYDNAIVDAADQLEVGLVIATLHGHLDWLVGWRLRRLARRLYRGGHQLLTLSEQGETVFTPSVAILK